MIIANRLTPNSLSISQDASNRTRVSQSTTQFDGKIVLVITPITSNITLNGGINWKEY